MSIDSTALTVVETEELGPLARRDTYMVMQSAFALAEYISDTDFVPKAFRGNKHAVAAAFLYGHEIGMAPMAALQRIFVSQNGKPNLDAAGQRALILAHGHEFDVVEWNNTRCIIRSRRRGSRSSPLEVTWTWDDVVKAKLEYKDTYKQYPRQMLLARATGDTARANFADLFVGMPYNREEAEDIPPEELEGGDPSSPPAGPTAPRGTKRMRAARAATAPSEPPTDPPDASPGSGSDDTSAPAGATPAGPPTEPPEAPPEGGAAEPTTSEVATPPERRHPDEPATGSAGPAPAPAPESESVQAPPPAAPPGSASSSGGSAADDGAAEAAKGEVTSATASASTAVQATVPAVQSPSGGPQTSGAERLPDENLSLAQRVAIAARDAGFESDEDRARLVKAVTGREKGARGLTRAECQQVIEAAHAIQRGEQVLKVVDGLEMLVSPEDAAQVEQAAAAGELLIPGLGVVRPD